MFSPHVAAELGYYVYRLIDPRNGETFYVGKGIGNRLFAHIKGEAAADEDAISDKLKRIREIHASDFEVSHVVHRHGLDEPTALEVEAALIDAYPSATNIVSGHDSGDRGVMHSKQIIERYEAKEAEFQHKLLLISINRSVTEKSSIYEAVRYAWKLDPAKAQNTEYVLAVQQGLIVGVFVADKWLEVKPENFAGAEEEPGRWGFIGREAPEQISKLYLRRRIPDSMRKKGAANPVRYVM